jgi:hypothetical protein
MTKIETRLAKLVAMHKFIRACEMVEMHRPTMGNVWARVWGLKIKEAAKC